jgi:uncharacterized protein (TIGR00730 family)
MKEETIKKIEKQKKEGKSFHSMEEFEDYRDTWRIFRIMAELVEGYNFLSSLEKEVTIFGSARFDPKNRYYKEAEKMGRFLGKGGFTTITGGGDGIMKAANKGAFDTGGESVGLNIQLPFEQRINDYVKKSTAFYYFFTRKVMMASPANAFIFFPGGFGTLDEFFEVIDLMDLGMMEKSPVVMVGKDFWQPILDFLKNKCCKIGSITEKKIEECHLVDTAEEAYELIKDVKDKTHFCNLSPNNFHCKGNIDWKIFRVMSELVEGFEFVTGLEDAITILGTKSIKKDSKYYKDAYLLGNKLALKEYAVVTGAKFGTAEAANKGAFEAGGNSIGIGMKIGDRGEVNPYLSKSILFHFPFTRKLIVTTPTKAFVFFPGGLGSMHHFFEIMTLIQTKKIPRIPVIMYDKDFWQPLSEFIHDKLIKEFKTIKKEDGDLFKIAKNVNDIIEMVDI